MTNNQHLRVARHKSKATPGFTAKYNVTKLVYYEIANTAYSAIQREKQLKEWRRSWKIRLIESTNPEWRDLSEEL